MYVTSAPSIKSRWKTGSWGVHSVIERAIVRTKTVKRRPVCQKKLSPVLIEGTINSLYSFMEHAPTVSTDGTNVRTPILMRRSLGKQGGDSPSRRVYLDYSRQQFSENPLQKSTCKQPRYLEHHLRMRSIFQLPSRRPQDTGSSYCENRERILSWREVLQHWQVSWSSNYYKKSTHLKSERSEVMPVWYGMSRESVVCNDQRTSNSFGERGVMM